MSGIKIAGMTTIESTYLNTYSYFRRITVSCKRRLPQIDDRLRGTQEPVRPQSLILVWILVFMRINNIVRLASEY